jgi:hypothetical protein
MKPTIPFIGFPKLARFSREIVITEKIDGTNAQIYIEGDNVYAGSRTRWIEPGDDNFGFAAWVEQNKTELLQLGPGSHFGEWWGTGIQRKYDQKEKHFSLFNTTRWCRHDVVPLVFPTNDPRVGKTQEFAPKCCDVVPELYRGPFLPHIIEPAVQALVVSGSVAAPGFMDPEGIVIYHTAAGTLFKKTCVDDHKPKSL